MKSNRYLARNLALFVIALVPSFLFAQAGKVSIQPANTIVAHPGARVTQQLHLNIQPEFHVNSDKPKDEYVIPLKLTWLGGPLTIESVKYPQPEEIKVGTEDLTVFTGDFNIESRFAVPQNATPSSSIMNGKLRYQACNNQMCLRPVTVDVHVPVSIQ